MGILQKWLILSSVILLLSTLLPTIRLRSVSVAFFGALAFGCVNVLFGWALKLIANVLLFLPRILSLGLFDLLIPIGVNMILLKMVDQSMDEELEIKGVKTLMIMATVITITLICLK